MEQNTQREKLIDLIVNAKKAYPETESFTEFLADFLIGYGVIVPDNTYELDRLRELVQADRDGRCVVLPVKTGDNIYFTFLGKIIEKQVFSVVTFCNSQRIYCNGTSEFFRPDDIGKTVFLTREAAEEALKGECNNEEVYKSNS